MSPLFDEIIDLPPDEVRSYVKRQVVSPDELAAWLGRAIAVGQPATVEALLDAGADPNRTPPGARWAAVHAAVACEAPELLRLVVLRGGDVNRPDKSGMTPLHLAIDVEVGAAGAGPSEASPALTRVLLELGADSEARDATGRTPSQWADQYGHLNALELMKTRV